MFKSILVPIDLADTDLAKPAIATAATLSQTWSGTVRLLNVLPMTPVMLAEYVPADFDTQQRQTSEEALAIVARESGIDASRISTAVRQGGIYHEILEEAAAIKADLIVMTSHRPAMRTYFLGSNAGHVVRYAGLLRRIKPPTCQANSAAKPTRNNAPANAPVVSARTRSPDIAIATNARKAMPTAWSFGPMPPISLALAPAFSMR